MKTSSRFWLAPLLVLLFAHTASAFYDTHIGRWLNRDPLGEDGGRQLYQFCLNSPVNFVDFHGLKVVVNVDGKTGPTDVGGDWTKVSQMITTICDKAKLNNDGTITMEGGFAGSQTQSGCCCLDQLVKSNNKWLVNLSRDEGAPRTEVPRDKGMNRPVPPGYAGPPAPGIPTGGQVFGPVPDGKFDFGSYDPQGKERLAPDWRVLGHELCGHAMHLDRGTHDPIPPGHTGEKGDRPNHDQAIDEENKLAREHGQPPRGSWDTPMKGESFRNNR